MANHEALEDFIVSETTPQGTQDYAVDTGHEARDIFVGSVLRWLTGVGVGTAFIIAILVGMFSFLNKTYEYQDAMPSPMFKKNELPPKPRIEGFMTENDLGHIGEKPEGKKEARAGTPEELEIVRDIETKTLNSFGIKYKPLAPGVIDDTEDLQRPIEISPAMVARIAGEGPADGGDGSTDRKFTDGGPSDASGGLQHSMDR